MAVDPKHYRDEALRLAKQASTAHTAELKSALLERAKIVLRTAIELERRMAFLDAGVDQPRVERVQLLLELQETDERIEQGQRIVDGWVDLMRIREAEGQDTGKDRELLMTFESTLETHRAHRDLILEMIDKRRG